MARNGEYAVKDVRGKAHYIILSEDSSTRDLEMQICKRLGLEVKKSEVSLAERGVFEPRYMVGPLAKETARERRAQINQNVSLARQQKK